MIQADDAVVFKFLLTERFHNFWYSHCIGAEIQPVLAIGEKGEQNYDLSILNNASLSDCLACYPKYKAVWLPERFRNCYVSVHNSFE
jgi:hypothetical protein